MKEEYFTEIRTSYSTSHDHLREMVSRWLNRKAGTGIFFVGAATWGRIILALRSTGEPQLADSLKAKYISGEFTTITSPQYSLESQYGENQMM